MDRAIQTKQFTYIFGGKSLRFNRRQRRELLATFLFGCVASITVVAAILYLNDHLAS